ncbi:MAG: hypothetical protein ACPL68_01805 [Candidatus Hydrothermia bacterium]
MHRTAFWQIGIVILLGLCLGITGFILTPRVPGGWDAVSYFTMARNLIAGRGMVSSVCSVTPAWFMGVPHPDLHMPGYPLLLAGFMLLTRVGLCSPLLLDALLIIITAVLVYFIIWFRSTPGSALLGSLSYLLFPTTLIYSFVGMAEIAVVFWIVLSVFLAGIPGSGRSPLCILGSGLALFMAYVTRESSIFILPLVLAMLVERGARPSRAIAFGVIIATICFLSSFVYYSLWPGFRDVQTILNYFSLIKHSGLFSLNPYLDIIGPNDFPRLSPSMFFLDILIRKPIRCLAEIWRAGVWYITALDILTVLLLVMAPIVVKERWQRLGLAFFLLIIPAFFILYVPTYDRFVRVVFPFALLALIFLIIRIKRFPIKYLGLLIPLVGLTFGIPGVLYYRIGYWNVIRESERLEAMLGGALPPGPLIIGMSGSAIPQHVLYAPEDVVVLFPRAPEDAALFREKIDMNVVVFTKIGAEDARLYTPEEMDALGWRDRTIACGSDTVVIYTRKEK